MSLAAEKEVMSPTLIYKEMNLKRAKGKERKENIQVNSKAFLKVSDRKKWKKAGLLSKHRNGVKSMSHFLPLSCLLLVPH